MTIEKKYIDQFINVTSKAAIASYHLVGKKDKIAADRGRREKIRVNPAIIIGTNQYAQADLFL